MECQLRSTVWALWMFLMQCLPVLHSKFSARKRSTIDSLITVKALSHGHTETEYTYAFLNHPHIIFVIGLIKSQERDLEMVHVYETNQLVFDKLFLQPQLIVQIYRKWV